MNEDRVERRFEKAFEQISSINPVFPASAREQMAQMVETRARMDTNIDKILNYGTDPASKGGFIAEEVHAGIFNLDAELNNDSARAYTDRYEEWKSIEWNGKNLKGNDLPDIVILKDGKVTKSIQSKYYSTAEETATKMSEVRNGEEPYYHDVDDLLGPSDQINGEYKEVNGENIKTTTVKEHATAKADALGIDNKNTIKARAYRETANKATSVIKDDKNTSKPLSKKDADNLGTGDKSKLQKIVNEYQSRSTLQQMGQAATGAAALSAVISGSINTVRYIQLAREGKITAEEATYKIIGETVASAADSAVKAASTTGLNSLMVRYGSRELAQEILAKQGLKAMLKGNAITVGVVCAVDAVKDLVKLGTGSITKEQFYERQGKGLLMTSAGVVGGSFGAAAASGAAVALGAATGSTALAVASVVGGLSGGLIAGLAMTLAVENGIEKPYRDLVNNTQTLQSAAKELEKVSETALKSQVLFTRFIEINSQMDKAINKQLERIEAAGQRARDIINKI